MSLPAGPGPIMVLGILPRSGTNYLFNLLRAHPDCRPAALREDFFVAHADLLDTYATAVSGHWNPEWGVAPQALYGALGRGLLSLLDAPAGAGRLLAKTPSVENLPLVFKFFPTAQVVILVRDGRSVVESGLRSFAAWRFEAATRQWAQAARAIRAFEAAHKAGGCPYRIVRYEDVYQYTAAVMRDLLDFLRLDPARYDFGAAERMPVTGSSVFQGPQASGVHWNAIAKPADFDPLARWRTWTHARHARFNWLAGAELRAFGYQPQPLPPPLWRWAAWNRYRDGAWGAQHAARRWRHRLRRLLGQA